jgi:hypothetical protein
MSQRQREKLVFFCVLGMAFAGFAIRYQLGW